MQNSAPFACFHCHTAFKHRGKFHGFIRICPHCHHTTYQMDGRFHPPKKSDQAHWKVVEYLVEHGFYYQAIHNQQGYLWEPVRYPDNLTEAEVFVRHFCDQAIKP